MDKNLESDPQTAPIVRCVVKREIKQLRLPNATIHLPEISMFKTRLIAALVIATLTTSTFAQTVTRSATPTPAAPAESRSVSGTFTPAPAVPSQPAPAKQESPVNLASIIIGLAIIAAIGSELTSGSAPSRSSSDRDLTWQERQRNENNRAAERNKPDTSVGCAWGDRSYGTCR
jgi:hypothetical protein